MPGPLKFTPRISPGSKKELGYKTYWECAKLVDIFHDILAARLQVGNEGCPVGDILEILQGQLDADRVRYSDQVKNSVGRSAQNHRQT